MGIVRTGMTGGAPCWDGELGDMGGTRTPWGQDDRGHVGIVGTGTWGAHGWTSWDRDTQTSWGQNHVGPIEGHHGDRAMGDGDMWGTRTPWGQDCVDTWTSWGQGHTWTLWGQDCGGHTDILGTKLWDTRTPWGQEHVGHMDGHLGDRDMRGMWATWGQSCGTHGWTCWDGDTWDMRMGILGTGTHGHLGDKAKRDP